MRVAQAKPIPKGVPDDEGPLLRLDDVRFGYADRPRFLGPVNLEVRCGQCWAIVGPNGSGKSTLLRLMAGLSRPDSGCVAVGGTDIMALSSRTRARQVAFVPQHPPCDLDTTVGDLVLMGRFPHRALGLFESASDRRVAQRVMDLTETLGFADRPMATLSGGEAQRVHIAGALAQEPGLLLLDEPTASLDLGHQLSIFRILRDQALVGGLGVVVVTHDVNLAARFCSAVVVLHEGRVVAVGPPAEVITPEVLAPVYGVDLVVLSLPSDGEGDGERRWVVPA